MVGRAPDAIFCPVGGGGLLAGIISYVRSFHRTANIKVVGVESNNADAMAQSLEWHRELTKDPELGRPLQVELDELKLEKLELEQRKLKLELDSTGLNSTRITRVTTQGREFNSAQLRIANMMHGPGALASLRYKVGCELSLEGIQGRWMLINW